jgi:hypothetical protein
MKLGVTLKAAEKIFGPALPGRGDPDKTLAAVHFAAGKGKKFAGVAGREDAVFHIHFPLPIDWNLLTSAKGTPDFINDLKPSGPQGEQGREQLVQEFLSKSAALQEKLQAKREAAEKKARIAELKKRSAELRARCAGWLGEHEATLTIKGESVLLLMKVTQDKSGKIKFSATL